MCWKNGSAESDEVMGWGGRPPLRHHRAEMRSLIATSHQGAVYGTNYHNRVGPCEEHLLDPWH